MINRTVGDSVRVKVYATNRRSKSALQQRKEMFMELINTNTRDQAIIDLWQQHQPGVLRYLGRIVHHPELAEDLCQETFLRALRGWAQHDTRASAAHWLYRIARNAAFDNLRRQRKFSFSPIADDLIVGESDFDVRVSEHEHVRQALEQLPTVYRAPLMLYSHQGYKVEEVATVLGCSANTIKTRLVRGRERFRLAYEQAG